MADEGQPRTIIQGSADLEGRKTMPAMFWGPYQSAALSDVVVEEFRRLTAQGDHDSALRLAWAAVGNEASLPGGDQGNERSELLELFAKIDRNLETADQHLTRA